MSLNTKPVIVGDSGVTCYFDKNMDGDYITIHDDLVTLRNGQKIMTFYTKKGVTAFEAMFNAINFEKAGNKAGFEKVSNETFLFGAINYLIGMRAVAGVKPYCYFKNADYTIISDISDVITTLYIEEYDPNGGVNSAVLSELIQIDMTDYIRLAIYKAAEYLGFCTHYLTTALREYLIHEIDVVNNLDKERIIMDLRKQGEIISITDELLGCELLEGRNIEITSDILPTTQRKVFVAQLFSTQDEFDSGMDSVLETLNTSEYDYDELFSIVVRLLVTSIITKEN